MAKEFGGLGVPNIRDLNVSLLGSWLKRYQGDSGKLWRDILDFKYNTAQPNIFYSSTTNSSSFFKGVMWAAKATKLGFKWRIGDGRKIRFWEDNWLGSSNLAIQYWDLYMIVNEKTSTVAYLWDGQDLKCTFRRIVDDRLYRMLSYGPPWAHYLGGYQDRLLGGSLGLPDLRCTVPDGVKHKDYRGEVLG
jgi:hypothetical protein